MRSSSGWGTHHGDSWSSRARSAARLSWSTSATRCRTTLRSCWWRPSATAMSSTRPSGGPTGVARNRLEIDCSMASWISSSRRAPTTLATTVPACSPTLAALAGWASQEPSRGGDGCGPELLPDDLGGEEVGLDERAQSPADVVLAVRDDGRVRDRQAERSLEQRGDGEPVGQGAHHRGLGEGGHVAEPRVARLEGPRHHEQHGGGEQQPEGHRLHAGEVVRPTGFVGARLDGARCGRGSRHPSVSSALSTNIGGRPRPPEAPLAATSSGAGTCPRPLSGRRAAPATRRPRHARRHPPARHGSRGGPRRPGPRRAGARCAPATRRCRTR